MFSCLFRNFKLEKIFLLKENTTWLPRIGCMVALNTNPMWYSFSKIKFVSDKNTIPTHCAVLMYNVLFDIRIVICDWKFCETEIGNHHGVSALAGYHLKLENNFCFSQVYS